MNTTNSTPFTRNREEPTKVPKSRRRSTASTSGRRSRPAPRRPAPPEHDAPDLIAEVAAALADDEPLTLLALVSGMLTAFDPRMQDPFQPATASGLPSREKLLETFFEVDLLETSALLTAASALLGDDVLRRRVRREVLSRGHALPRWLTELDGARPAGRTVRQHHVLGDGESILLGVELPGGHELAAAVYVDHNLGTVVKDAFVVPGSLDSLASHLSDATADPDTSLDDLDLADARARVTEAVQAGAMTYPPLETDTWPACRPLVEWVVGLLPAGGVGYERPEWDETALAGITERFLGSPFGAGLDDPDARSLLESLLWFSTDYGPGDPLRWSPPAVEILLADWIPRKIVADVEHLTRAPEVLRAFVRFSHAERGIRPGLTEQVLAAVDAFEPEYQATIRSPRPQGPEALLAGMDLLGPDSPRQGRGPSAQP